MKDIQLYLCVLTAPGPEQMAQATEHLRYWPYVKAYCKSGPNSTVLVVNVGKTPGVGTQRLLKRSRELISLCLRQYGIQVSYFLPTENEFFSVYKPNLFLRPDECLKPFSEFINELENSMRSKNVTRSVSHCKMRQYTPTHYRCKVTFFSGKNDIVLSKKFQLP